MAAAGRRPPHSVAERLFAQTYAFEFGQAIALLQKMYPEGTPPGEGLDPRQETVRLSGPLTAEFASSSPARLTPPVGPARQPHLYVNVFGLGGPDGPLPYAWQEWLQFRRAHKDHAPMAFLDLFHQRLLGQLYRVGQKYRVALPYTAPDQSAVLQLLRAFTGLLPGTAQQSPAATDLLARSALVANRRRSVGGFQSQVQARLGMTPRITQFDGAWFEVPAAAKTRLGRGKSNNRLGMGAMAGQRIWDEHAGICITLGPLVPEVYLALLPGGATHSELMALTRFYFGVDMRIRLQLKAGALPPARLGMAVRLGWSSWLPGGHAGDQRHCVLRHNTSTGTELGRSAQEKTQPPPTETVPIRSCL